MEILMTNNVHLVAVPERPESFARELGRAHYLYAWALHEPWGGNGHLWQNRFLSCPLGRGHLRTPLRYVDLNPLRAGLVKSLLAQRAPRRRRSPQLGQLFSFLVSRLEAHCPDALVVTHSLTLYNAG